MTKLHPGNKCKKTNHSSLWEASNAPVPVVVLHLSSRPGNNRCTLLHSSIQMKQHIHTIIATTVSNSKQNKRKKYARIANEEPRAKRARLMKSIYKYRIHCYWAPGLSHILVPSPAAALRGSRTVASCSASQSHFGRHKKSQTNYLTTSSFFSLTLPLFFFRRVSVQVSHNDTHFSIVSSSFFSFTYDHNRAARYW